ncbi:MAG: M6 family metalloprotease domain-containing protein [Bacteroidia bacterium]|nr:M6 family metalloprotease domain-containing protein [Bacteroidia bacterium]
MQRRYKLFLLLTLLSFKVFSQNPSLCPAYNGSVLITQPDGSTLEVVGKGNSVISYTETTDGYTLLKNSEGIYEYAIQDLQGEMNPSGIKAHNTANRSNVEAVTLQNIPKMIRMSENSSQLRSSLPPGKHYDGAAAQFPTKGKRKVLLILMEFPNLPATIPASEFVKFMNEPGFSGTGSFRDYYLENSNGQLDLDADVMGWYMAKNNYQVYGNTSGNTAAVPLVAEAVDAAEAAGVDFSKYDNNNDGKVDAVIIIHSGLGAEQGSQLQYIWSHRWSLSGTSKRTYDSVVISDYSINPEKRSWGMVGIGVMTHEFGHLLGLPDLYDTKNAGEGIGEWGLMGSCGWLNSENTPCHMEAWSKSYLGWINPTVIDTDGAYMLDTFSTTKMTYRINTPNPSEYFLLENRQKIGFDTYLKGSGMAVFHINEDKTNTWPLFNSVNGDVNDEGVALIQADGLRHLEKKTNRSDAGDLFPGSKNKTELAPYTTPNTSNNMGDVTDLYFTDIKSINGKIYFNFYNAPKAKFDADKLSGCAPANVNLLNQSAATGKYLWNFKDGGTSKSRDTSHIYNQAGIYNTTMYLYIGNRIIDSAVKQITVYNKPVADFNFSISGNDVKASDLSSNATMWNWDMGNGTKLTGTSVNYNYKTNGKYNVTLTATNGGCSDTISKVVSILDYSVLLYPNPSSNGKKAILFISLDKPRKTSLTITNSIGANVMNMSNPEVFSDHVEYDISASKLGLAPGIYYIRMTAEDKSETLRWIVQE